MSNSLPLCASPWCTLLAMSMVTSTFVSCLWSSSSRVESLDYPLHSNVCCQVLTCHWQVEETVWASRSPEAPMLKTEASASQRTPMRCWCSKATYLLSLESRLKEGSLERSEQCQSSFKTLTVSMMAKDSSCLSIVSPKRCVKVWKGVLVLENQNRSSPRLVMWVKISEKY